MKSQKVIGNFNAISLENVDKEETLTTQIGTKYKGKTQRQLLQIRQRAWMRGLTIYPHQTPPTRMPSNTGHSEMFLVWVHTIRRKNSIHNAQ